MVFLWKIWLFTYNFWFLFEKLLLQELSFFLVVTPSGYARDDCYCEKNSCTFNPSICSLRGSCKTHIDNDRENGTNDEDLQHEIIKCTKKKSAERCSYWSVFEVGTKHLFSWLQGSGLDTLLKVDIKGILKSSCAVKLILQVSDVLNIFSLSIFLDKLN